MDARGPLLEIEINGEGTRKLALASTKQYRNVWTEGHG